jgi:hypothetical protein
MFVKALFDDIDNSSYFLHETSAICMKEILFSSRLIDLHKKTKAGQSRLCDQISGGFRIWAFQKP